MLRIGLMVIELLLDGFLKIKEKFISNEMNVQILLNNTGAKDEEERTRTLGNGKKIKINGGKK